MEQTRSCKSCGQPLSAAAPEGLCPRCLMAGAMQPTSPPNWTVPGIEAVRAAFPHLEVLSLVGAGGMGAVFQARQPQLDRFVAMKILAPERTDDARFAERFQREAQALARLNHPHIVAIHDFGKAGGFYYLLMEFVDGVNLRQAMKAGRFTPAQALAVVPPVCEALQFAHEHGVVHRDIKPENVLLDKEGRVKIADFGIAKMLHAGGSDNAIAESQPAGTPQYMAPEQKEHRSTDHRADIYSLGVVLYELLTGELPADKLQAPSKKVQIDVRLDEIVLRALEKEPELRYQTATEFRTQVETITSNRPRADDAPHAALRAPLKSSRSYFTTPEHLATFPGGFWWPMDAGELALYDDRLVFAVGWERTEIPFRSFLELGAARLPRWMSPAGHQHLSVIYDDQGQRKHLLFMPGTLWFRTAGDTEQLAAEWIMAIRDAVKMATGKNLLSAMAEPLVVPASPWGTLLVLLPPLFLGGLALWLLMAVQAGGGSGSLSRTTFAPVLILVLLSFGAAAALGGSSLRRRNRGPANAPGRASFPVTQKHRTRGYLFAALLLGLLSLAIFLAMYVLSQHDSAPHPPLSPQPARLPGNAEPIPEVPAEKP